MTSLQDVAPPVNKIRTFLARALLSISDFVQQVTPLDPAAVVCSSGASIEVIEVVPGRPYFSCWSANDLDHFHQGRGHRLVEHRLLTAIRSDYFWCRP